jgi:hypothetical protein
MANETATLAISVSVWNTFPPLHLRRASFARWPRGQGVSDRRHTPPMNVIGRQRTTVTVRVYSTLNSPKPYAAIQNLGRPNEYEPKPPSTRIWPIQLWPVSMRWNFAWTEWHSP